jgi:3-dehydroquinate synthase
MVDSPPVEAVEDWKDRSVRVESHYSAESISETRLELKAAREIRYSVVHPTGYVLDRKDPTIRRTLLDRPVLAVVDQHVDSLYGSELKSYLAHETNLRGYLLVHGQESAKTWAVVQRICETAIDLELPRDGVMLAVGGGVTLDVTGFAASVFRRGVNFVRIPTSLIGQIDVGVGIKQAINVGERKSIVGTFYPAIANINDPTFLTTLPRRHIACGMAEIIKMAMVGDADLVAVLEAHAGELVDNRFQNSAIAREVLIRAEILMMSELQPNLFEDELRRLPDFGHTFSPAIEAASCWSINHGEAVGMDMLISAGIAVRKGLCGTDVFDRLRNLLLAAGLPVTHEVCGPELLMKGLRAARQNRAGDLNLVVPVEVGKAKFIQDVDLADLSDVVTLMRSDFHNGGVISGSWGNASPARNLA